MNETRKRRTFRVFAISVGAGLAAAALAVIMLTHSTTQDEIHHRDLPGTFDNKKSAVSERFTPSTMRPLGKSLWVDDEGFIFDRDGTRVGVWGVD